MHWTSDRDWPKLTTIDNCTRADPAYGQGMVKALGISLQATGNKERT